MFEPEEYLEAILKNLRSSDDDKALVFGNAVYFDQSPISPSEAYPQIAIISVSSTTNEETYEGLTPSDQTLNVSIIALDRKRRKQAARVLGAKLSSDGKVIDLIGPIDGYSQILDAFVRAFEVTFSFQQ